MPLPADAVPVNGQQSNQLPSDAIPINQESSDLQDLMPVSKISQTSSVDTVPIVARAASGLMRTPQGKADVINKISPNMNAQVTQDGKITVNGNPFDLSPENLGAFIYDLPGMMGEAATKNIPLIANISTAIATGGMSLPAQIALQGAATGTAEGIKELMAQGLAQEKPNIGDIAMQAALGSAGPIADQAFMATAAGMKSLAKHLGNFTGSAKDIGPELLNATAGIKLGVGEKVFNKMDSGEDLSRIITPENASSSKPSEILSNTFFGNPSATRSPENFVNTLKDNIMKSSSDNIIGIKKMYQDVWGLSPQTIETVIKNPTKDIINSSLFSDNAPLTVGASFANKLKDADKDIETEYGKTLMDAMNKPGFNDKKVNIGTALDEMFTKGSTPDINPTGVGIFSNNEINAGYTGDAAKKVYGILLNKLQENKLGLSKESLQVFRDLQARNPGAVPKDIAERMTKGGHYKELSAPAAYKFIAEIKPLLDKTFEGSGLSGAEKSPLAGFIKNIRNQLGDISPEMKAMNEKYETYQSARTFFGDGKPGNLQDMLNINNKMSQAYADPGIRTFLEKIDQTVGNKDITNMINHLGASQEMKAFFDKATGKVEDKLQGMINNIKGLADKTANHSIENMAISGYDSLLPQGKKFLDPMWNHLIASEFQNKPLSIFKSKYIGLMALSAAGMGHAGVLPALGVGLQLSSPRNISRGLMTIQKMKGIGQKASNTTNKIAPNIGKAASRTILNNLVESGKKQQRIAQSANNRK